MSFRKYLTEQVKKHPSMQPQDIVKLCFQAAFGAEHLLSDLDTARQYLIQELENVEASDGDLYEIISDHVCRVNLAVWKYKKLPAEWLFHMFAATASVPDGSEDLFLTYLETVNHLLNGLPVSFLPEEWHAFLQGYQANGLHAVHHSSLYREKETPSYRILHSKYIRLFPILEAAAAHYWKERPQEISVATTGSLNEHSADASMAMTDHPEPTPCIIAIDGRTASGKTTMASQLAQILDGSIVHMDDFFLPPELRREERFQTPGGNIHHERFREEVLPYLCQPQEFSYRRFDCGILEYNGKRTIPNTYFRIVEGAYSCHPVFGNYATIKVYADVTPEEQQRRILHRDGPKFAVLFHLKWIPMEETYLKAYEIAKNADIIV